MGGYTEPIGQFWVNVERDPEGDGERRIPNEGVLYSKPIDDSGVSAPRDLGTFAVRKRYNPAAGFTSMAVCDVVLNTGQKGWGQIRDDRGGWLTVYPVST
jgi:hypothetical protein